MIVASKRDEFSPTTKRILAERVAWKCCFPNCGVITVGPMSNDSKKSINLGEAAHIHAAASKGPRFDSLMSVAARKSIDNGIWMCRPHATLIDMDNSIYSAQTLRLWKSSAESVAYDNLKLQSKFHSVNSSTFVQIGLSIILSCKWSAIDGKEWRFEVLSFYKGRIEDLIEYIDSFGCQNVENQFLVVESQGDARRIATPPKLSALDSGGYNIAFNVQDKHEPTSPHDVGTDLALDENHDLKIVDGDLVLISGIDAAIQSIKTTMSTIRGEMAFESFRGSLASIYYHECSDDMVTLSRLFKLELIRLSLIPIKAGSETEYEPPPIGFVKRFNVVEIENRTLQNSWLPVWLELDWGLSETWKGMIEIYISSKPSEGKTNVPQFYGT